MGAGHHPGDGAKAALAVGTRCRHAGIARAEPDAIQCHFEPGAARLEGRDVTDAVEAFSDLILGSQRNCQRQVANQSVLRAPGEAARHQVELGVDPLDRESSGKEARHLLAGDGGERAVHALSAAGGNAGNGYRPDVSGMGARADVVEQRGGGRQFESSGEEGRHFFTAHEAGRAKSSRGASGGDPGGGEGIDVLGVDVAGDVTEGTAPGGHQPERPHQKGGHLSSGNRPIRAVVGPATAESDPGGRDAVDVGLVRRAVVIREGTTDARGVGGCVDHQEQ